MISSLLAYDPDACDCCACPAPVWRYAYKSVSKSKCGFQEYGTPSSPPRRYRTKTISGSMVNDFYSLPGCDHSNGDCDPPDPWCDGCQETINWSGAFTYVTPGCLSGTDTRDAGRTTNCASCTDDNLLGCVGVVADEVAISTTQLDIIGTEACVNNGISWWFYQKSTGTLTETLSDEYTTAELISEVQAELDATAWSAWSAAPTTAVRNLSDNEVTYTEQRVKYRIYHPAHWSGCYRLWLVEFITAEGAGGPTDFTYKSYEWDGVTPPGYDEADSSTWPFAEFEVSIPEYDCQIAVYLDGNSNPNGYDCNCSET